MICALLSHAHLVASRFHFYHGTMAHRSVAAWRCHRRPCVASASRSARVWPPSATYALRLRQPPAAESSHCSSMRSEARRLLLLIGALLIAVALLDQQAEHRHNTAQSWWGTPSNVTSAASIASTDRALVRSELVIEPFIDAGNWTLLGGQNQ